MEQKNLILAIVLSAIVIIGWSVFQAVFFPPPPAPPQQQQQASAPTQTAPTPGTPGASSVPSTPAAAPTVELVDRATALKQSPRVPIDSPRLKGSVALKGGRIDDVELAGYHETVDPNSPNIVLLSPAGAPDAYFAEFGWCRLPDCGTRDLPNKDTLWSADGAKLSPDKPLTLTWDNGQGLRFTRVFSLDANYMFTVAQRVENYGAAPVALASYGQIQRLGTPHTGISTILHEGPIGAFGHTPQSDKYLLYETKYSKIREKKLEDHDSVGGWLGITDKYWLVAAVPDSSTPLHATYFWELQNKTDLYQVSYRTSEQTIAPGATVEATANLFAGAKEVSLIDSYAEDFQGKGIPLFDRAVDFTGYLGGITYALTFIAKPLFYLLDFIYRQLVGNFGVAIMILTVLVKGALFPIANKSYRSMNKMKRLGPKMQELRTRFADDKARLNQEMMDLYKKEKVNPAAGCLPLFIQMPVFLALYQVLYVTIEMRQAPFFGWIKDLSATDPTSVLNLFGLLPWSIPHGADAIAAAWGLGSIPLIGHPLASVLGLLNIGVWPLVLGVTMFLQQKMNPPPPDPVQAKIMTFLPIMFTFMMAQFQAGLVIYWSWNNLLSIGQQWLIKRMDERANQQGPKPPEQKTEKQPEQKADKQVEEKREQKRLERRSGKRS